ncbi:MAG: MFS transporter [Magnetovibrio sp.]|nr:MFS transporter [Magnetovibrio sp.]
MIDASRIYALKIFQQVIRRRKPLSSAIIESGGYQIASKADSAFAERIVKTALKRLGQIDQILGECLAQPLPKKARVAQDVLRLGAAQILFMEVPDHAAVHTSVQLFHAEGEGRYAKLINAILRRLTREGCSWINAQDETRLNTPDWLWHSWSKVYGIQTCREIASAHLKEAPIDISVKANPKKWAIRLGGQVLNTNTVRLEGSQAITNLEGYNEGSWWVQDVAANIVSGLIGDVRGKRIIDLCAAPGGKTAALASAGAIVTAIDSSATRLQRLRENLTRLQLKAHVIEADAKSWRPIELADAVLLDAPCTGTGIIRRHPDIAHCKTASDVMELMVIQETLLVAAVELVKPGGIILYSTCSLQPEEGLMQIERAKKNELPIRPLPFTKNHLLGMSEMLTSTGTFLSLPSYLPKQGHMDGFFACRFEKL